MRGRQSRVTIGGQKGVIESVTTESRPMNRLLLAASALTASFCILSAIDSTPATAADEAPIVIGEDQPVLLGRMVVTATALPDDGR